MTSSPQTRSAEIRRQIGHPVIDSDGHMIEFGPAVHDYVEELGGKELRDRFVNSGLGGGLFPWYHLTPELRDKIRMIRPPWWPFPTRNTLDRATGTLPKLLHERLEEFGVDFTVLYPTVGLFPLVIDDTELRQVVCRAFNKFHAELLAPYADRMTPVAIIPMHTPEEAVAELDYAIGELGMKGVMLAGYVRRTIPIIKEKAPAAQSLAVWLDTFTIDSPYDYDPVWAKCEELKVAPTFHSGGMGWGSRMSPSSYVFNHIGNFAAAGEAICRSLLLGGVPKRFPNLKFAFLEGGVGWGCTLYSDSISHWKKRNRDHLQNYNPANLDRELWKNLFAKYGEEKYGDRLPLIDEGFLGATPEPEDMLDEFAASGLESPEEIRDIFTHNFYFGCEADDPVNAWAFNKKINPYDSELNVLFSSDIGHWDVPDMREVTEEAYELVEKGLIDERQFRDFVFRNPVNFWAGQNPDFFKGTSVEKAVKAEKI